jgi:Raf kinase inhibitor-like YbhB/YbcL family protein
MIVVVRTTGMFGMPATRLLPTLLTIGVLVVAGCAGAATSAPTQPFSSAASGSPARSSSAPASSASAEASPSQEKSSMPFTLTSTAFQEGGKIPRKFSCDGENVSPALEWSGAPDGTAALALIVDDTDANGFVHWVVFDMTGSQSGGLTEAVSASPDAPTQGKNSFGKIGWGGPCPPSGTHHYRFRLYALDATLGLAGTPSADDVKRAAEGHILDKTELTATYTRGG